MKSRVICVDNKYTTVSSNTGGFTAVELLITIGILGVVFAGGVSFISNYTNVSQLVDAEAQLEQGLRTAYTRARSGVNNADQGVLIEQSQFTIFQGSSYATRDSAYDRVTTLSDALSFSAPFAGNEVVFKARTGLPNATGTVTITHSVDGARTVLVNDVGLVE